MPATNLTAFCASLDRLGVGWTRVRWREVGDAVRKEAVAPVVAAPWPFAEPPPGWSELPPLEMETLDGEAYSLKGKALQQARTGVTGAYLAIADYGTIVLRSDGATEVVSLLPTRHVAVVRAPDIVADMVAAFARFGEALRSHSDSLVLATGPSATADMGALVQGAHGPEEVHVIIAGDAPATRAD